MDNPQHYQPLSHALHPPQHPAYTPAGIYNREAHAPVAPTTGTHREEEEEEEEEGDEEVVEEQLNQNDIDTRSSPSSPRQKAMNTTDTRPHKQQQPPSQQLQPLTQQSQRQESDAQEPEPKRRPGRPRGSKNRRPRGGASSVGQSVIKQDPTFHNPATAAVPQHPDVNPHNQQYYEFQWRVLNLCAEFYGAAEELVKGTPPLVIAQCYQMGPGNKVDPLVMLNEAKRICDTLLANPAQLITNPPPPMYTVTPTPPYYSSVPSQPLASTSATAPSMNTRPATTPSSASTAPMSTTAITSAPTASTSKSTTPTATAPAPPVMTANPQSYLVSLAHHPHPHQPSYAHPQYSVYPGQYPTTSYYQYGYSTAGAPGYYSHAPAPTQSVVHPPPPAASTSTAPGAGSESTSMAGSGNQGAWSEDETDKLKKLADESKAAGMNGEALWDWVVQQWGNSRTRHQILIKATSMGLKESSTRGVKRRRDAETGGAEGTSPSGAPVPSTSTPTSSNNASTSTSAPTPSSAANAHPPTYSPVTTTTTTTTNPTQNNHNHAAHHPTQTQTPAPNQNHTTHAAPHLPSVSPAQSSTPSASPALTHLSRPSSQSQQRQVLQQSPQQQTQTTSASQQPGKLSNTPWPMPTVAVNTPSPIVAAATIGNNATAGGKTAAPTTTVVPTLAYPEQQRTTSYYRARPSGNFVYERPKENGK